MAEVAKDASDASVELLAAQPLLARVAPATLHKLQAISRVLRFDADAYLFREGNVADRLFLLVDGHVVLETHAPGRPVASLESLLPGDICGLSWLFTPFRWHLDARAAEPTRVVAVDGKQLRAWIEADPDVERALLQPLVSCLYQRLERVRMQRLDVYRGGAA